MTSTSAGRPVGALQSEWSEFPLPPQRRAALMSWPAWVVPAGAAWIVVGLGPTVRTASISIGARGAVVAVTTSILVALAFVGAKCAMARRVLLAAPAVVLVAASTWAGGRWVGIWILAGCVLALLGLPVNESPGRERSSSAQLAVAVSVAAAWWGRDAVAGWRAPAAMLIAAPLVHLCVAHPAPVRSIDAGVRRVFTFGGLWLQRLGMFLLGLVVVVIPWFLQRLTRWDPTWSAARSGSRWVERGRTIGDPLRPWDPDPARRARTPGRRAHLFLIRFVAVLGVLAVVLVGVDRIRSRDDDRVIAAAAMADAPWWPALHAATETVHRNVVLNTYLTYRLPDVSSPYLNIVDGVRSTWSPRPAPSLSTCAPLRVWMLGGSAMFGDGQRDDATIASRLAQLADEQGIRLQVENLGVPGDVAFIEARRLEARLATSEQRPDLVVFYDGYNDLAVRNALNSAGDAAADEVGVGWVDATLYALLQRYVAPAQRWVQQLGRDSTLSLEEPAGSSVDAATVVERALRQYGLGIDIGRRILDDDGLESVRYLQPNLYTRVVPVDGEPDPGDGAFAEMVARFRQGVPDGVVDLGAAVNGDDQPVYYDDVHTNETGADRVARAMFVDLAPRLQALCSSRGPSTCC